MASFAEREHCQQKKAEQIIYYNRLWAFDKKPAQKYSKKWLYPLLLSQHSSIIIAFWHSF
jgi:hypothetical protein